MRPARLALVLAVLSVSVPAVAQEWELYQNIEDGFKCDFPGPPTVTSATWNTEQGYVLPARVYSVVMSSGRYSVTVVDYTVIGRLGLERSEKCPVGAETCQGQAVANDRPVIGPGYSTQDIRGALVYASSKFIQRDAKVTAYLWNWEDMVEGHEIHLTNNADQSRTMAFIALRQNKLYILEGTVPKGYPEPEIFFTSLGWVDRNGNGVRYQQLYVNEIYGLGVLPEPAYGNGGIQGFGGPGGQGPQIGPAPDPATQPVGNGR
jgi:hypothetical protein